MAYTTQYVGMRYVPRFADPAEWDKASVYEALTIVLHKGNSYTSRQAVPAGIEIDDEEYWLETGNYSGQVEQYRQEVATYTRAIRKVLPLDTTPTAGSTKGIDSNAVYETAQALQATIDALAKRVEALEKKLANVSYPIKVGSTYEVIDHFGYLYADSEEGSIDADS